MLGGLKFFFLLNVTSAPLQYQPGLVFSILADIQRVSTLMGGRSFAVSVLVSQGRPFTLPAKFLGAQLGVTTQLKLQPRKQDEKLNLST